MKYLSLFSTFSLIFLTACSSTKSGNQAFDNALSEYKTNAIMLVQAINKQASFGTIRSLSDKLISSSTPIIKMVKEGQNDCNQFLDKVLKDQQKMKTISLKEIETLYHEGQALPDAPDKCYLAKELTVHPATVFILSKKSNTTQTRQQMSDEITEVLAHLDDLNDLI